MMKWSLGSVLLLTVLLTTSRASAQETSEANALDIYRENALSLDYSFFRGMRLMKGDQDLELGYFGRDFDAIFDGSDRALNQMERFLGLRVSGFVIQMLAITGLVAEVIAIFAAPGLLVDDYGITEVYWGWLAGAIVVGLVGNILSSIAQTSLFRAVRYYNEDFLNHLRSSVR